MSSSGFCGHYMSGVSIRQSSKFYVNEQCNHVHSDWLRFTYNYSLHSLYPGIWWLFILAWKQECAQDRLWSRSVVLPGIQSTWVTPQSANGSGDLFWILTAILHGDLVLLEAHHSKWKESEILSLGVLTASLNICSTSCGQSVSNLQCSGPQLNLFKELIGIQVKRPLSKHSIRAAYLMVPKGSC